MELSKYIRDIPDFPKKGILYKDITPLLQDARAFSNTIEKFYVRHKNSKIDKVIGIESRGFIFGSALALKLDCSFIPIRKQNKLPYKTFKQVYNLEYGTDCIEIHEDALKTADNVLIIDDVLATGGTACAAIDLLANFECNLIECLFLLEIAFLKGKDKILDKRKKIFTLLKT